MAKFDIHSQKLKSTDTMNVLIPSVHYLLLLLLILTQVCIAQLAIPN